MDGKRRPNYPDVPPSNIPHYTNNDQSNMHQFAQQQHGQNAQHIFQMSQQQFNQQERLTNMMQNAFNNIDNNKSPFNQNLNLHNQNMQMLPYHVNNSHQMNLPMNLVHDTQTPIRSDMQQSSTPSPSLMYSNDRRSPQFNNNIFFQNPSPANRTQFIVNSQYPNENRPDSRSSSRSSNHGGRSTPSIHNPPMDTKMSLQERTNMKIPTKHDNSMPSIHNSSKDTNQSLQGPIHMNMRIPKTYDNIIPSSHTTSMDANLSRQGHNNNNSMMIPNTHLVGFDQFTSVNQMQREPMQYHTQPQIFQQSLQHHNIFSSSSTLDSTRISSLLEAASSDAFDRIMNEQELNKQMAEQVRDYSEPEQPAIEFKQSSKDHKHDATERKIDEATEITNEEATKDNKNEAIKSSKDRELQRNEVRGKSTKELFIRDSISSALKEQISTLKYMLYIIQDEYPQLSTPLFDETLEQSMSMDDLCTQMVSIGNDVLSGLEGLPEAEISLKEEMRKTLQGISEKKNALSILPKMDTGERNSNRKRSSNNKSNRKRSLPMVTKNQDSSSQPEEKTHSSTQPELKRRSSSQPGERRRSSSQTGVRRSNKRRLSSQPDDKVELTEEVATSSEIHTSDRNKVKRRSKSKKKLKVEPNPYLVDDHEPERLVNLMLELPQFPHVPKGAVAGTPTIHPLPQGAEVMNLTEIYFPKADTHPVSFLATLLGYDTPLPTSTSCSSFLPLDSITVRSQSCLQEQDAWMHIPRLGRKCSSNSDLKGNALGDGFDYSDPFWLMLLSNIGGADDSRVKDAVCSKDINPISEECIQFAKDLRLIDDDITFRLANLIDIDLMNTFAANPDECPVDFTQILKSPSDYVLISVDRSNKKVFGFVHYKFCYHRLEETMLNRNDTTISNHYGTGSTAALVKKSTALELVLHIKNIHILDEPYPSVDQRVENVHNTSKVISLSLTSLVLEHARHLDVMYGITETSQKHVSFLKTYFRMDEIENIDETLNKHILACDLNKCSFRYAFLSEKESSQASHDIVTKDRMLVNLQFPTRSRITPTQNLNCSNSKEDIASKVVRLRLYHKEAKAGSQDLSPASVVVLTNNSGNSQTVLEKKCHDTFSNQNENTNFVNDQDIGDKSAKQGGDDDIDPPTWEVLRTFALNQSGLLYNEQCPCNDSLLDELKKCQSKLRSLEQDLFPKVQNLVESMYDNRLSFETDGRKAVSDIDKLKSEYDSILARRREEDIARQLRIEEDMDAVCDVCHDGEVTQYNQILFCESCNVAVHQNCYGIEKVPEGDYYCHACRHFERNNNNSIYQESKEAPSVKLPIVCELCPRRDGAFIKTFSKSKDKKVMKWVHVICAKWQGFNYVEGDRETIEDVSDQKKEFVKRGYSCCLCKGMRGTYNQCSASGCNNWMHVTCARSSGMCNVFHGENHAGLLQTETAWQIYCPDHSTSLEPDYKPHLRVSIEVLEEEAKAFPPDLPPKPFYKLSGSERKKYLSDSEYESDFINQLMTSNVLRICEVCDYMVFVEADPYFLCSSCNCAAHEGCVPQKWLQRTKESKGLCPSCIHREKESNAPDFEVPSCHMCHYDHGFLLHCKAKPIKMKRWTNKDAFKRSLFGKALWCHPVCGMWHNRVHLDAKDGCIECVNIIMADGFSHIGAGDECTLCGRYDRLKMLCTETDKKCNIKFHLTCARQAGFDVKDQDGGQGEYNFVSKCFQHSCSDFVFRALLENMIEIEKVRCENDLSRQNQNKPMTLGCANQIFSLGIKVMRSLGWAWRWVDWWVPLGDNWEPYLDAGQNEAEMTDEELGRVRSTPDSRCQDARRCRLAALGAALRNRDFDKEEGDNRTTLDRALRAVLNTPSLVGPLTKVEIDFFAEWLGIVYRSKSPKLGFGDDKIKVADNWSENSSVYYHDKSPKFELGNRPLPGKQQLAKNQLFEEGVCDVDDFELEIMKLKSPSKKRSK